MRPGCAAANLAWLLSQAPAARRFAAALPRAPEVQRRLLAACLRRNASTAFGREHGFARLATLRDYQAAVPLRGWDELLPWMARVAAGEPAVLTAERVRLLEPTSGSSAAAKLVPYTASLQAEIRAAVAPWITDLVRRRPGLLGGPAYWAISPLAAEAPGPVAALPVGFEDDAAYLGGWSRRLVNSTLAVPSSVRRLADARTFRHVTLLHLLAARELRLISVWHPSFLMLLLDALVSRWDALLADLARGRPRRAAELARLGPGDVARIWPRLQLVSCWGDGPARLSLAGLEARLPHVEIQPKGLVATEACVTLPFRGERPLAVTSHVFEFLGEDGVAHAVEDLERGGRYSIVVTTGGGLYRYRLDDLVEVTGFLGRTPCLRFLGRGGGVSDLCGEKLAEGFVTPLLERVLAEQGVRPRFVLLAPDEGARLPRYALFLGAERAAPRSLGPALDAALRANPHYALCRRLGQLDELTVAPVGADAYARLLERCARAGQREGQVKPMVLSPLPGWRQALGSSTLQ